MPEVEYRRSSWKYIPVATAMSQEIWINLLVKDVERSTVFFNEIGFHAVSVGNERAKLAIGQTTILLFPDAAFEKKTYLVVPQNQPIVVNIFQ
ncbi:hypothetical protein BGM26_04375 [Bacillus sp. FJAT-29790]|uniref:hypothetical protein n=1 Tax=Bacillus sp. FJAT-29790 TaxID=1895002 RepID=UPI001C243F2A|nr:hypothetical protein [Bacillus sp. FJAT-29790]MBU8878227.1 hypothetical protein [Bacillus sp. FJAT-29790]